MSFRVVGIGEVLWDLLPAGAQLGGAPQCVEFVDENDARRRFSRLLNRSRTRAAPKPTKISTEPEMEMNATPASPTMARAIRVLPFRAVR